MAAATSKNLYQKLVDVKANIEGFTKEAKGYNYDYVEGSQILHKIRAKMEQHKLLLFPKVISAEYKDIQVLVKGKMKPNILVALNMVYTFVNADKPDETLEIPFYAIGHQADASQAYGTALTYAERYFLLKFFNIPTDEDDADTKQKRDKYTKADAADIEALQKGIKEFAEFVNDTEQNVMQQLNIISYDKLSVANTMQALTQVVNWKNDMVKQQAQQQQQALQQHMQQPQQAQQIRMEPQQLNSYGGVQQ